MAGVRSKEMAEHASCIVGGFVKLLLNCHMDNTHNIVVQQKSYFEITSI